jgi:hypothetical protein
VVHLGKAIPSLAKAARLARKDTSDVMRHFRSGKAPSPWSDCSSRIVAEILHSRNCTKHNCRCDYMDTPAASDETARASRPPELPMTPETEREINIWRVTGDPPFPELRLSSREYWQRFSSVNLRLIHHIAGLSSDMHQRGYAACTVWAQNMPAWVDVESHDLLETMLITTLKAPQHRHNQRLRHERNPRSFGCKSSLGDE